VGSILSVEIPEETGGTTLPGGVKMEGDVDSLGDFEGGRGL